jgi:NADPH2:quinone reductase
VRSGVITAQPETVYPFDRLVDAHRELEQRRTTGATILRID